jgi:uncharacterized protein (DUF1778 family)
MRRSDKKQNARLEIRLNTKQYDAFVAMLAAPAKARPRLGKLLTTPSVLERRGR